MSNNLPEIGAGVYIKDNLVYATTNGVPAGWGLSWEKQGWAAAMGEYFEGDGLYAGVGAY
jgi:hypothetical protein